MPYGEVSPSHRERFLPGSLRPVDDVYLNIQHDLSQTIAWRGAGLSLADSADGLRIEAGPFPRTPIHNAVLADVNAGKLRGVSVEFRAQRERTDPQTGIRVIEAAALKGFGLVPDPSYPSARVTEVRARIGGRISGRANLGRPVSCRCRTGCDSIQIEPDAMDAALAEAEAGTRQIHAFFSGRYDRPLASVGAGLTLRRTGDAAGGFHRRHPGHARLPRLAGDGGRGGGVLRHPTLFSGRSIDFSQGWTNGGVLRGRPAGNRDSRSNRAYRGAGAGDGAAAARVSRTSAAGVAVNGVGRFRARSLATRSILSRSPAVFSAVVRLRAFHPYAYPYRGPKRGLRALGLA